MTPQLQADSKEDIKRLKMNCSGYGLHYAYASYAADKIRAAEKEAEAEAFAQFRAKVERQYAAKAQEKKRRQLKRQLGRP